MVSPRPDGGWGWVIAFSLFFTNVIVDGVKYSFGIMFIELLDTFSRSNSETSWILSIQMGASMLSGPLIGALVNRFGCRRVSFVGTVLSTIGFIASPFATSVYHLYATFGVVAGLGFSMMNLPGSVSLMRYFDKKLAVASGLAAMGSSMGAIVFSPLIKILIDQYTWRGTVMVEAGIVMNGLICALVLRPVQTSKRQPNESLNSKHKETNFIAKKRDINTNTDDMCLKEILVKGEDHDKIVNSIDSANKESDIKQKTNTNSCKTSDKRGRRWISLAPLSDPGFWLLIASTCLIELGLNVPYTYLPDMMNRQKYEGQQVVWIIFVMGVTGTVCRAGIGFVATIKCVNRVHLCISTIILSGILVVICPFCIYYEMFVAFAILFGGIAGSSSALRYVLIPDLFGVEMIADCLGLVLMFQGITAFIGLPIAGAVFDASGTYTFPFVMAGVELILSGCILLIIPVVQKKHVAN